MITRSRSASPLPLATALLTAACASGAPPETVPGAGRSTVSVETAAGSRHMVEIIVDEQITRSEVPVPIESAWARLVDVYAGLGFEPDEIAVDPDGRRVEGSARRMRRIGGKRPSHYVDCGRGLGIPTADQGDLSFSVRTVLSPGERGTAVETRVEATARPSGTSSAPLRCTTRGKLEERIRDELMLRP